MLIRNRLGPRTNKKKTVSYVRDLLQLILYGNHCINTLIIQPLVRLYVNEGRFNVLNHT